MDRGTWQATVHGITVRHDWVINTQCSVTNLCWVSCPLTMWTMTNNLWFCRIPECLCVLVTFVVYWHISCTKAFQLHQHAKGIFIHAFGHDLMWAWMIVWGSGVDKYQLSPRDSPRPAGGLIPGSYEVTAFAQGSSACEILLHPPKAESLFPPILGSSCNQAPLAFKAKYSGALTLLRSMMWGSEEDFCNIMFSILWVARSDGMGLDYVVTVILLPSCGFLFASLNIGNIIW